MSSSPAEMPLEPVGNSPPPNERRVQTVSLVIIAVILSVAAATYLGPILKPLMIAIFLYFLVNPAALKLRQLGVPLLLAYLLLLTAVCVFFYLLGNVIYVNALEFAEKWDEYEQRLLLLINNYFSEMDRVTLRRHLNDLVDDVFKYSFEASANLLEQFLLVVFYLVFIILNAAKLNARVKRALPSDQVAHVTGITAKIRASMEQYLRVKTLVSLGMGASISILLLAFGLDYWLLWGFLFFLLNYITYIGSMAACVPPMVLALVSFESFPAAITLSVLVMILRFVWIDYVEITHSGDQLNLDTVLLFVFLAYLGWVWGAVGLVLAVPILTSIKIVLENFASTRRWAILMSEE